MLNLARRAAAIAARGAVPGLATCCAAQSSPWRINCSATATATVAVKSTGAVTAFHTATAAPAAAAAGSRPLPPRIKIDEGEIVENFLKGSGPGGQKIVSLQNSREAARRGVCADEEEAAMRRTRRTATGTT